VDYSVVEQNKCYDRAAMEEVLFSDANGKRLPMLQAMIRRYCNPVSRSIRYRLLSDFVQGNFLFVGIIKLFSRIINDFMKNVGGYCCKKFHTTNG
jgi:hypothetical protein